MQFRCMKLANTGLIYLFVTSNGSMRIKTNAVVQDNTHVNGYNEEHVHLLSSLVFPPCYNMCIYGASIP